jgi:TcdA/TcdB pore forming domain
MSLPNSSNQTQFDLTEKLKAERDTTIQTINTVNQGFIILTLKYKEFKEAVQNLASKENIDLKTSYLILENTKKVDDKYELQFVVKGSQETRKIETNDPTFYAFKETFNKALNKARLITQDEKPTQSTRALVPALKMEALDVIDAASWGTAIASFIEYANSDEEISSLTTTLQIQAYYGLFQSGLTLGQGAFSIAQTVSDLAGNKFISLSEKIGDKILLAAKGAKGLKKTALNAMGKIVSNSLTIATGVFSIVIDSIALAKLDPNDPKFNSSVMSLSFNVISFSLGLVSIFGGSVASSFAGSLAVPLAGFAIALGGLIQMTDLQWENCRRLGEYTKELEKSYLNFLSNPNQGTELNLIDNLVIVGEVNLKTRKVQLWTPWLPKFYPPSAGTVFSVGTDQKGNPWEVNYKKYTGKDLPLTKTFNVGVEEVILPILPHYKIYIEKIGVGPKYHNYTSEILALPKLSGSTDVSWGWYVVGYEIGFTKRVGGPIEYSRTDVKVIGSDSDDILITLPLEELEINKDDDKQKKDEKENQNKFIKSIRNFLTYNIEKSKGSCLLVVSKYAKYQITLGKDASLLLNLSAVDNFDLDYQNSQINFAGNWVKINSPEGEKSIDQIIIVDNKGKCQKVNFSAQSLEIVWIDSELYHKATNKSIENELMTGKNIDPFIDSAVTIPIKNAAKDYQESKPSTRCSYGFYFRNKKAIQFLDAPGKLPSTLSVIKCLPDQVMLRQKVTNNPNLPGEDFYYYVKKDDGSFKIEFSGKPHSQALDYLITGKLPSPRRGILKDGCPTCGSGNIEYMPDDQRNIYIDPLRCLDCNFQFTRYYPPSISLLTSNIEEIHNLLLKWSSDSNEVYSNYINLVMEASESNYNAQQSEVKQKIEQLSQQVIQELNSESGKGKLAILDQIYWSLTTQHERDYLKFFLRPAISNLITNYPPDNLSNIPYLYGYEPSDWSRANADFLSNWAWSEGLHSNIQQYFVSIITLSDYNYSDININPQLLAGTMYYAELTYQQLIKEPGQRKLNELLDFDQSLTIYGKFRLRDILKRPVANLLPKVYDENVILTLNQQENVVDQLLLNQQENLIDEILLNQEDNIPDDVPLNPQEIENVQYRLLDWALLYSEDNNPQGNFIARYISLIFDCYQKPQYLTDQYELYLDVYAQEVNRKLNDKPEKVEKLIELYQNFKTRQKLFVKEILRSSLANLLAESSSDDSPLNQEENVSLTLEEKTRIYELLREWTGGRYGGYLTIDDYISLVFQADENSQFAEEEKERIEMKSHEISEQLKELPGQLDDLKQIYQALNTPEQIFVRQILRTPVSNLLLEVIKLDNESVSLNQEQQMQIYTLLLDWTQREYGDYGFMSDYIHIVFGASQDPKLVREYKTRIDEYVQDFSSQLSNNPEKLERLRQLYGELNTQEQIFARKLLKIPVVNLLLPDNENVSLNLEVNVSLNQPENISLNQEQNVPLNRQEKIRIYDLLVDWTGGSYGDYRTIDDYIRLVFQADENPQFAEQVKEKIDMDSQQVGWELIEAEDPIKLEQLKRLSLILKTEEKVFLRKVLKPLIAHLLPDPYTEKVSLTEEEKGRIYDLLRDWLGGQQRGLIFDYINAVVNASYQNNEDEGYQVYLDSLSFEVRQKLMDEEPEKLQQLKQLSESLEKPEKDFLHELLRPVVASLLN